MSIVTIHTGHSDLVGELRSPRDAGGIIVFARAGDLRTHPVADRLADRGFAVLGLDLLTPAELRSEEHTHHLRFDLHLLANRLLGALDWIAHDERMSALPVGLFASSTASAAALIAASRGAVAAVVSCCGRPDLAEDALRTVRCPTLLIIAADDPDLAVLNRRSLRRIPAATSLRVVPRANDLASIVDLAAGWCGAYLASSRWLTEHAREL